MNNNEAPKTTAQLNGQAAAIAKMVAERQAAVAAFGFSAGTVAAAGIKPALAEVLVAVEPDLEAHELAELGYALEGEGWA